MNEVPQGLLVLSRDINESVMIGDDIEVFVVKIGRGKVRLGFRAPREVQIHRREIYDKNNRRGDAA